MSTSFNGINIIHIRMKILCERGVIAQRDLNRDLTLFVIDVYGLFNQFFTGGIQIFHEFFQPVFRMECFFFIVSVVVFLPEVGQGQSNSRVQKGKFTQTGRKNFIFVYGYQEYGLVGFKGNSGSCPVGFSDDFNGIKWFSDAVLLNPYLAIPVNFRL